MILNADSLSTYSLLSTPQNTTEILKKRLRINGLLLLDIFPKHAQGFFATVPALLESGAVSSEEYAVEGFDRAIQAFVDTLGSGGQVGKPVIVVGEA